MNDLIAKLLQPVSAQEPCGPDLSYDPRLDQLETILLGKPEIEIGSFKKPAEPPDWRELNTKSAEFLAESKHLRVAIMFCCSLLRTAGLSGFRDGAQLLAGLVDQYWIALYPRLDPDDNNDPTQRLNLLSALAPSSNSSGLGWLTFADYLASSPLCTPKGAGPITYDQIQAAKLRASAIKDGSTPPPDAPDLTKLEAALRSSGHDQVANSHAILLETLEAVNRIDTFLTTTLGAGGTISFESLQKLLQAMISSLAAYRTDGASAAASGLSEGNSAQGVERAGSELFVSGPIRSRQDVTRALDGICEYYRQVEPGSPVPFLLRRAQMLANMNFVQAVQELNLGTLELLRPSMGSAISGMVPASEAPAPPASS